MPGKEVYQKRPDYYRAKQKAWADANREKQRAKAKTPEARANAAERVRNYNARMKKKLFLILGGARCSNPDCAVPGGMADEHALQFDHIHGGGTKEKMSKTGYEFHRYYVKRTDEACATLQVLCANCNWIKRHTNGETRRLYKVI